LLFSCIGDAFVVKLNKYPETYAAGAGPVSLTTTVVPLNDSGTWSVKPELTNTSSEEAIDTLLPEPFQKRIALR
jgi:hypothetical protein